MSAFFHSFMHQQVLASMVINHSVLLCLVTY